ncbi:MAG: 4-hydroxythreonine-4-phosphate dehydrogenase PdxA [Candidatus Omnitrophota bacterium]|jgi:4-hydroxythreonine-4-phosphate dehydrogenase|nr:MAG: 4-hydroxythreonine-4-phosphate dehydrogenase PdxA [Candidatus Omnitrophota bacterium]
MLRIGITMGDPSGVGPEIILKALNSFSGKAKFRIVGDAWVLAKIGKLAQGQYPNTDFYDLANVKRRSFKFGKPSLDNARCSVEYLDFALGLLKNGQLDCLVTAPVSKEWINSCGIKWRGHTEYIAEKFQCKDFAMMLLNGKMKFILATRHIPLASVSKALNAGMLFKLVSHAVISLKTLFGINRPRLVICALNPHASDNGVIGSEENNIIKPAVMKLKRKFRHNCIDLLPADIAIYKHYRGYYDCAIALYHDQSLIALKLTDDFNSGVNLTLGLGFVRTSPLHGTAFDIAGTNRASHLSFLEAINTAIRCTINLKKS